MEKQVLIKGLSHKYEDSLANSLHNIHLEIHRGEWLSICGHNGSGKSTLAKFLNGLLLPTAPNCVLIEGIDTFHEEGIWEVRKRVGIIFQNPDNQIVATTVRDDVAFGLENIGVPQKEIEIRMVQALKKVKMENYENYEPHRLSGGQKQRVAIAGIIAMKPSIIILDEATSMLDPVGRKDVLETVRHLNKEEGITVINITHELEETIYSDRMVVMQEGEIILSGSPKDVFKNRKKIIEAGLDLPFSQKVSEKLAAKGYSLKETCLSKEELVEELWKLHLQT